MSLKTGKRCSATRWCNVATSCQKARDVENNAECPTRVQRGAKLGWSRAGRASARLGVPFVSDISNSSEIAERSVYSANERSYCHMDKVVYGLSDHDMYGAYPVPKCTPPAPEVKLFRDPDPPDVIVTNSYTKAVTTTSQVTKTAGAYTRPLLRQAVLAREPLYVHL
jgi:hypothetical protein